MKESQKNLQSETKINDIHVAYSNNPKGAPFKVVYHNDWDGIAAAWAVRNALKAPIEAVSPQNIRLGSWQLSETEFIPVQYGFDPPDTLEYSDVLIVDFSYKRPIMEALKEKTKVLVCLDHHGKAEKELEGLDYCIFDNSKAGCILAWEYFHSRAKEPPLFLKYVDDRDRWQFRLPQSRALNAVIRSYNMTFESCDELNTLFNMAGRASIVRQVLIGEGEAILRFQGQLVKTAVSHARPMMIEDYVCLGVNMPLPNMVSETGEALCDVEICKPNEKDVLFTKPTFGVCWFHSGTQWVYSLRSRHGFDVSELARKLGGGGHKGAAGFQSHSPPWYYETLYKEASMLQIQKSLKQRYSESFDPPLKHDETPMRGGGTFPKLSTDDL